LPRELMPPFLHTLLTAFVLLLAYAAAAVPWAMLAFDQRGKAAEWGGEMLRDPLLIVRRRQLLRYLLLALAFVVGLPFLVLNALSFGDPSSVETTGMLYGASLQLQLI